MTKSNNKGTKNWFYMGDGPRPCYTEMESLYDQAKANGEHPVEAWMRLVDETNGNALFHLRGFNHDLEDLERLLSTEWAMPGLGDSGAHVSQMVDSGWATFVLSYWHRERGIYSLPEAIARLSSMPARVLGIDDRGTLAVGKRADINVLDLSQLEERMPEVVNDLPFCAPRFIQRAGLQSNSVQRSDSITDDELTGARPGRVLRNRQ